MNTTNLLIRVEHHADISKPEYLKHNNSIVITSPVDLIIEPRSDAYIDLQFNITFEQLSEFQELLHSPTLWLKPSTVFGTMGLDIEDKEKWVMNRTQHNAIQLHLLNRSFYYNIKIKKSDILGFAFFLGKLSSQSIKMVNHIM